MEIYTTDVFDAWIGGLKDEIGRGKIISRIDRMRVGHLGDSEPVGAGVSELRIGGKGPGYRIYYSLTGREIVILLCGGGKRSQQADIAKAKAIAAAL